MSESSPSQDSNCGGRRTSLTVVGVLVLIYFVCPLAYIYPVLMITGKHRPAPAWLGRVINVAFYPVIYLDQHVPAYRAMLEQEADWLGLH